MTSERNLGVTEARLGLSLLTCLLVALGYFVIQRLGDTGPSPHAEIRPDPATASFLTNPSQPAADRDRSQGLPAQGAESIPASFPHTSQRPLWLAPQQGGDETSAPVVKAAAATTDFREPGLFELRPLPAAESPGATPRY